MRLFFPCVTRAGWRPRCALGQPAVPTPTRQRSSRIEPDNHSTARALVCGARFAVTVGSTDRNVARVARGREVLRSGSRLPARRVRGATCSTGFDASRIARARASAPTSGLGPTTETLASTLPGTRSRPPRGKSSKEPRNPGEEGASPSFPGFLGSLEILLGGGRGLRRRTRFWMSVFSVPL